MTEEDAKIARGVAERMQAKTEQFHKTMPKDQRNEHLDDLAIMAKLILKLTTAAIV